MLGDVGGLDFTTEVVGDSLALKAVPLPGTLWLLAPGLAALAGSARRRRGIPAAGANRPS